MTQPSQLRSTTVQAKRLIAISAIAIPAEDKLNEVVKGIIESVFLTGSRKQLKRTAIVDL